MGVAIIIQARMDSTRLPGKVLREVSGQSLLAHIVERLQSDLLAPYFDDLVVATTVLPSDDVIVGECERLSISVVRGSVADVLSRYVLAASHVDCETVVRITGDCPLIDPALVLAMLQHFADNSFDYLSNDVPGIPLGQGIEVFRRTALERAGREALAQYQREHVTPYFYDCEGRFSTGKLGWPTSLKGQWPEDLSAHRWTVDTPEDFELVRRIFEAGYQKGQQFGVGEILEVLALHPTWPALNSNVVQKHYLEIA